MDSQIAALTGKWTYKRGRIYAKIRKPLDESQYAAIDQIQKGISLWQTATTFEQALINADETAAKRRAQEAVDFASRKLHESEAARNALVQQNGSIDDRLCKSGMQGVARSKGKAERDATNRWSSYLADLKTADETKTKEYVQITNYFRERISS